MKICTIKCNKHDCENEYTEVHEGAGFPHWGHIGGLVDTHGNTPHICPECKRKIYNWLKGDVNDLG